MPVIYRIALLSVIPPQVIHGVIDFTQVEQRDEPRQWELGLSYKCEDGSRGSVGLAKGDQILITRVT